MGGVDLGKSRCGLEEMDDAQTEDQNLVFQITLNED